MQLWYGAKSFAPRPVICQIQHTALASASVDGQKHVRFCQARPVIHTKHHSD